MAVICGMKDKPSVLPGNFCAPGIVVSDNSFVISMRTMPPGTSGTALTLRPDGRLQYGGTVTGGRRVALA